MRSILIFFCGVLLHGWLSLAQFYAQSPSSQFEIWHIKETGNCFASMQDQDGYLLLATDHGIMKFDGVNLESDASAVSEVVYHLHRSQQDEIWAGTASGAVFKATKPYGLMEPQDHLSKVTGIVELPTHHFLSLHQNGEAIMVASRTRVLKSNPSIPFQVNCSWQNQPTEILIGTQSGLIYLHLNQHNTIIEVEQWLTSEGITSIVQGNRGHGYWIGCESGAVYWLGSGPSLKPTQVSLHSSSPPDKSISCLLEDQTGKLWIGSQQSTLSCFQVSGDHIQANETHNFDFSVQNSAVKGLTSDLHGQVWVSTVGKGLLRIRESPSRIPLDSLEGLVGKIQTVTRNSAGRIWAGTEQGLFEIFPAQHLAHPIPTFSKVAIQSLQFGQDSTLWIGTGEQGLYNWDPHSAQVRFSWNSQSPAQRRINTISESPSGKIWVGSDGGVISIENNAKHLEVFDPQKSFFVDRIQSILVQKNGRIWIGTAMGIWVLNEDQLQMVKAGQPSVKNIVEDQTGRVWIATDGEGILRMGPDGIRRFGMEHGLLNNAPSQLFISEQGELYSGHSIGYCRWWEAEDTWVKAPFFPDQSGLSSALHVDKTNSILLANQQELWMIPGSKQYFPDYETQLFLHSPSQTHLTPNEQLSLSFTAVNLKIPNDLYVQYRLGNENSNWSIPEKTNSLTLPKLPKGEYRVEIRALNANGTYTSSPVQHQFTVQSPFLLRPWVWGVSFLLVIGLTFLGNGIRLKQHKKRQVELKAEVRSRTEQLQHQTLIVKEKNEEILRLNNKLEIQLKSVQVLNHAIVSSLPDPVMILDNKGEMIDIQGNPDTETLRIFRDFQGKFLIEFLQDKYRIPFRKTLKSALDKHTSQLLEFRFKGDLEDKYFEARISPLEGTNQLLFLIRDQTQRVLADQEKRSNQLNLTRAVHQGMEEERKRFAKDLHDGVGGMLTTCRLHLIKLENEIEDEALCAEIALINERVNKAINETRAVSHGLMPGVLADLGLVVAIEDFCNGIRASSAAEVHISIFGLEKPVSKEIEIALYRILMEALNNALRHGKATHISLSLNRFPQIIEMMIEDNGKGFTVPKTPIEHWGIGIKSMISRAESLGGWLDISSSPGQGTIICTQIPLESLSTPSTSPQTAS